MKLKRAAGLAPSSDPVVLLVDDEPIHLQLLSNLLARHSVRVLSAASGLHALDILKVESVALVVSDYWMRGMNGIQLLDEVKRLYPSIGRILLTGEPDAEIVVEAKGHKVLTKGMSPSLICRVIVREAGRHAG